MADEKIAKQIEQGEPEGPLNRLINHKNAWAVIAIVFAIVAAWIMRPWSTRPVAPERFAAQQRIIDQAKQESEKGGAYVPPRQTPKQDSAFGDHYKDDTGLSSDHKTEDNRQNRTTVAPSSGASTELDPMKILKAARFQREVEYSFKPHVQNDEPKAKESGASNSPAPALSTAQETAANKSAEPLYLIPEGTIVPATLTSRIQGEQAGFVDAVVSEHVYLPGTRHIVIPQGAKALGTSQNVTGFGQRRLAMVMRKIQIFPQGFAQPCVIDLGSPALDQAGSAGLTGKVDNHLLSTLAAASVVALIQGASIGFSYGGTYGTEQILIGNMSSSASQVTARLLDRFTNRPPSITVPEGSRLKLVFLKDTASSCEVNP